MAPLPDHRPEQLSLGPLESEILDVVWNHAPITATSIHEHLTQDPDRELTYPSVMKVLRRIEAKGWVTCERNAREYWWQARVSREEADMILAHQKLQSFLSISNPDIVAAFADSLDHASLEQIEAIAQRLRDIRQAQQTDQQIKQPMEE
ncbi:MAG: BlaI/MecI/CopY family transcriptional regulator [Leptolyngbyaceae bacterium]|nr:BlaI/MecI/CopY family transcriptional regulator [Leptolyngbyaceae bacterium]